MSCLGVLRPKYAGTERWNAVLGPRPSCERKACHAARPPSSLAPPQSPEIGPIAGNRATRPSGATPAQFVPKPHTTATPHDRSVPARRTANVSLRRIGSPPPPLRGRLLNKG